MAIAKVALSLPAPLLTRIDRLSKKSRLSRSAFVRQAVEQALGQPAEAELLRKAARMYAEIGEEDRTLAETFLPLAAKTLPTRRLTRKQ
jgi:metal-responsive CopG/Arc/MetJ family transcriptional regulator